jgi:hypothetical protein
MKKIYPFFISILFFSCSTQIQYVGNSYQPTSKTDVYVTESAIKKPYSIIGQGYIKPGKFGTEINWNKIQKESIKHGREHGADAVLIVQRRAISPLPAITTNNRIDSVNRGISGSSRTETYYPVSAWHEIFFLKYE